MRPHEGPNWSRPPRLEWLAELRREGLVPRIVSLLRVPAAYARGMETRCIVRYTARGYRLTNAVAVRAAARAATELAAELAGMVREHAA